jgi:hypothetical protein
MTHLAEFDKSRRGCCRLKWVVELGLTRTTTPYRLTEQWDHAAQCRMQTACRPGPAAQGRHGPVHRVAVAATHPRPQHVRGATVLGLYSAAITQRPPGPGPAEQSVKPSTIRRPGYICFAWEERGCTSCPKSTIHCTVDLNFRPGLVSKNFCLHPSHRMFDTYMVY